MKRTCLASILPLVVLFPLVSCSSSPGDMPGLAQQDGTVQRILSQVDRAEAAGVSLPACESAWLEETEDGLVSRPRPELAGKIAHPARVKVRRDRGPGFELRDVDSNMAIHVTMPGARKSPPARTGHRLTWPDALGPGLHVVQAIGARGIEDYAVADEGTVVSSLFYEVELTQGVAGLRLVDGVLEFIDEQGAPRLRMARPWVADKTGKRVDARTRVDGCDVDLSPVAPWGRKPVRPGADRCEVKIEWDSTGLAGPAAMVDPAWITTGAMLSPRISHGAISLDNGKVLVACGNKPDKYSSTPNLSAELFDPSSLTWAAALPSSNAGWYPVVVKLESGKVLVTHAQSELYDPATGFWTSAGKNQVTHTDHYGGAALLGTGRVLAQGELFDPASNLWTPVSEATGMTFATLPDGRVLSCDYANCGVYDDVARSWTPTAPPPSPISTVVRTASGVVSSLQSTGTLTYSPVTNSWSTGAPAACSTILPPVPLNDGTVACVSSTGKPEVRFFPGNTSTAGFVSRYSGFTATALQGGGGLLLAGGEEKAWEYNPPAAALQAEVLVISQSPLGGGCAFKAQCASGFCVDGVCCNIECTGPCQACSKAKKGFGADGQCDVVASGYDPDDECAAEPVASCGRTGNCDGSGACGRYASGTACKSACSGGTLTEMLCDGAGSCSVTGLAQSCGLYLCASPTTCGAGCNDDSACAVAAFCDTAAHMCVPDYADGLHCTSSSQCQSGYCADGVCCNSICNGLCEACSAVKKGAGSDGTCGPVSANTDPDNDCIDDGSQSCGRNGQCDGKGQCAWYSADTICGSAQCVGNSVLGNFCAGQLTCTQKTVDCAPYKCMLGACPQSCSIDTDCTTGNRCVDSKCAPKLPIGESCSTASECATGFCADGYCCDSLCGNQCEACNEPDHLGTCIAISGAPRGSRPKCTGDSGECAGTCGGGKRDGCEYPDSSKYCGNTRCDGQVFKPETCDGLGSCVAAATKDCGDYACDSEARKCKVRCASDKDCATGRLCNQSSEQCAPVSHDCKDDFTAVGVNGIEIDCAPYKCAAGACRDSCSTSNDCVGGFACEGSRCRIAPAVDGGTGPDGAAGVTGETQVVTEKGCGCSTPGSGRTAAAIPGLMLAITALLRRRCVSR